MNMSFSQSADSILTETFEERKGSLDSLDDRPVWSNDDILVVNTTKTNVDLLSGRVGGHHAHVKKKRARLLSKKLEQDSGVSSASLNYLSGQATSSECSRPLPLPPVPPAHRVPMMGVGALPPSTVVTAPSPEIASLPLLHRIVKTINIWYHADIDRAAAMNLLMLAEMGCFILRKSSRERTLALTVRNARPHDCDHYLIFLRNKGLQIEGSFLTFQSIPKLIEYYCVHLRELPYLLKLPDIITNCSCDRDLETYNNMGTDFWSKIYPYYGSNQFRRHQPQAGAACDQSFLTSKDEAHDDCWTLNSGVATSVLHSSSQGSGVQVGGSAKTVHENQRNFHDPTSVRVSGTSSVDNLVRLPVAAVDASFRHQYHADRHQPTFLSDVPSSVECSVRRNTAAISPPLVPSNAGHDMASTSGVPVSSSKTRSVDSLNTARQSKLHRYDASEAGRQMTSGIADPSSYRSSLVLRVSRTNSDTVDPIPSYDVMWEASEGRLPQADPSPPIPATPPPPPPHAPPPPLSSFDIRQVAGFPKPDRFRAKFTFDEFRPHNPAPVVRATPMSREDVTSKSSVVYDDPIDLIPNHGDNVPPAPPPRRHFPGMRGGRPPLAGGVIPADLRAARSDDSLNLRVEGAMRDMNKTIESMEADLNPKSDAAGLPRPPHFPRHSKRPVSGVVDARISTVSEMTGDPNSQKSDQLSRCRRLSQYDNVSSGSNPSLKSLHPNSHQASVVSVASSRGTIFSNPWDNSMWHQLLQPSNRDSDAIKLLNQIAQRRGSVDSNKELSTDSDDEGTPTDVVRRNSPRKDLEKTPVPHAASPPGQLGPDDILRASEEASDVGHDMVKRAQARISEYVQGSNGRNVGASVDKWLADLTVDRTLMFGQKLTSFIECTRDSSERNPHIVMRNIRQFMDGIKHYLVQRDETGFKQMIENERKKLAADEFLNVERRLESALYNLVLKPLKTHLDNLMVDWHHQLGNLRRVRDNIRLAAKHTAERLGIRNGLQPPSEEELARIQLHFKKMEAVYSPLEKLECLLDAVEVMYSKVPDADSSSPQLLSADEHYLMPVFTYVLVRCELVSAELEAEYMQGLLASKFLLGEGAYYLSTLQAAVTVIKNFHRRPSVGNMTSSYEDLSQLHGVLRVIVLNERTDSTNMKTFPARPTMTARDLSILVAHRCHIFNPQDFSLYHFKDGKETNLRDLDLPYKIKVDCESQTEKPCHFLYRRTNAVFALPLGLNCGR